MELFDPLLPHPVALMYVNEMGELASLIGLISPGWRLHIKWFVPGGVEARRLIRSLRREQTSESKVPGGMENS